MFFFTIFARSINIEKELVGEWDVLTPGQQEPGPLYTASVVPLANEENHYTATIWKNDYYKDAKLLTDSQYYSVIFNNQTGKGNFIDNLEGSFTMEFLAKEIIVKSDAFNAKFTIENDILVQYQGTDGEQIKLIAKRHRKVSTFNFFLEPWHIFVVIGILILFQCFMIYNSILSYKAESKKAQKAPVQKFEEREELKKLNNEEEPKTDKLKAE
ncbi:hypothetical protein TVAG_392970 [Trichomonas vaginalis G3]|uniref:Uncharacterized protein n=1 Tax=Trichomonas vaginalis (strain ATCC PRA-98 / G3) TaxID=412133 RepID=A2DY93_TRIV3|nr:hypothetical protein TVAGG3_0281470 [Trichomonas vaginalis G3]EAY14570.1 hypothetical protein TVAG_392970 [Trichomonas vaginalis G3]KAI5526580.1 hypothetical protein TVAGG3_0281470 [Trichomonas vaginalis G3]|eukprot:XP_001326793.1 hypothetical protein [Trichomonas vaginalis G3]